MEDFRWVIGIFTALMFFGVIGVLTFLVQKEKDPENK